MSWILSTFSLFCVVLVLDAKPALKPCCAPNQFESLLTYMGAQATEGAKPAPVIMSQTLSYDYDNKKMAVTVYEKSKEVEKLIYKYSQNKYYVITPDEQCFHFPINSSLAPPCIPDDAVMMGSIYLGGGDEKLALNAYYVQQGELNIYGSYTPNSCYPATEGYIGETDSNPVIMTIMYSNTTRGIADQKVFDVPKICTQGEQDDLHPATQHVLNKYSRK